MHLNSQFWLMAWVLLVSYSHLAYAFSPSSKYPDSSLSRPTIQYQQPIQPIPHGIPNTEKQKCREMITLFAVNGEEKEEKKRSLLYRVYRVSTYPVRRIYRLIVPKETTSSNTQETNEINEEEESLEEDLDEIKEIIDETVTSISENIDETVSSISENIASALKSKEPLEKDSAPTIKPPSISLPSWPAGRSATAPKGLDLTGEWDLIVTDEFKESYDKYLTLLGQPFFVRSVALSIVSLTTEKTEQSDNGVNLFISGQNLRGLWERTLTTNPSSGDATSIIVTADGEKVECEAWWEGQMHHSWLRGVQKYGGGSFESKRFLQDKGNTLVCESTFHPDDQKRDKAQVTWRFERKAA